VLHEHTDQPHASPSRHAVARTTSPSEPQFDAAGAWADAGALPDASVPPPQPRARRHRPRSTTLRTMISPRIDRLLENVDSNYASVVVAAKRARQINSYYHNLGEGTFDEFPPPMVDTGSKNYLTIALEEVAAGKIKYQYR
jgi:DNA-directed RNA polymerase subunit omega